MRLGICAGKPYTPSPVSYACFPVVACRGLVGTTDANRAVQGSELLGGDALRGRWGPDARRCLEVVPPLVSCDHPVEM